MECLCMLVVTLVHRMGTISTINSELYNYSMLIMQPSHKARINIYTSVKQVMCKTGQRLPQSHDSLMSLNY